MLLCWGFFCPVRAEQYLRNSFLLFKIGAVWGSNSESPCLKLKICFYVQGLSVMEKSSGSTVYTTGPSPLSFEVGKKNLLKIFFAF